ncbi:MAG: endonuclease domain-containing protein [Planctomycetes bacterium]|nr:endonuclease domain-containing protein [Planctomycetota bacterium]
MTDRPTRHRIPPRMTQRSRSLRRRSTYPERVLWYLLRNKQIKGLRFRRQHAVGRYVVDFYCPAAKLVVEVDGESHAGRAEQDAKRSAYLEARGLKVLRVTNDDVMENLEAVGMAILDAAGVDATAGKVRPSPSPPP